MLCSQNGTHRMHYRLWYFFEDMGFTKEAVRNRDVLIESRERNAFMSKELQIRNGFNG